MRMLKLLPFLLVVFALILGFATPTRAQDPVRIMPLGDSITQADINHNSYRRPLWQLIETAHLNADFVGSMTEHYVPRLNLPPNPDFDMNHEGHAGLRADEILAQIPTWAANAQPDIVLLHIGTNDVMQGQGDTETRDEISQIIDALRVVNPSVVVILAQVIPHDIPPEFNTPPVDSLNLLIAELAVTKSTLESPVVLVDIHTGFNILTDLDPDRIHPSVSGENLMALRWFNALKRFVPTDTGTYELLTNGGFELMNSEWRLINTSRDRARCNLVAWEGSCVFRFRGSVGEASRVKQVLNTPPVVVGDTLSLSASVRTTGTPNALIRVVVIYEDGTRARLALSMPEASDYTLLVSNTLVLSQPVQRINVVMRNATETGSVFIDALRLQVMR